MRWTRNLNIDLMRAYYTAAEMETNKTRYRDRLEEMWKQKYPSSTLTAQRLSDQVRSILNRRALSAAELENIKRGLRSTVSRSLGAATERMMRTQTENQR